MPLPDIQQQISQLSHEEVEKLRFWLGGRRSHAAHDGTEIVYKFLSGDDGSLKTITSSCLKLTLLADFNDPFEALMQEHESIAKAKAGFIENLYEKAPILDKQSLLDQFASGKHQSSSSALQARYLKKLDQFGVLCLSKTPSSGLMWSHYANSHRGFCIGFDRQHPWFEPSGQLLKHSSISEEKKSDISAQQLDWIGKLINVTYHPERIRDDETPDSLSKSFFWKADYWAYERELRLLFPLNYDQTGRLPVEEDERLCMKVDRINESLYLRKYPKEMIKEIIFGSRCSLAIQEKIRNTLASFQVAYKFAIPSSATFDMVIEDSALDIPHDPLNPSVHPLSVASKFLLHIQNTEFPDNFGMP